jgi:YedE family putative selenium metabolism protein
MEFFKKHWKIISCGIFIGIVATLLQKLGNPANMGICVACFERDIAGALGFHRIAIVQYIRPEILAFVLGSFASSLIFKEFKPRGGSLPLVRFFLGFFAMFGALVFLGCPWRALLRLTGGDWNAIIGLAGLVVGVFIGVQFIKGGYNLGRNYPTYKFTGLIMPPSSFAHPAHCARGRSIFQREGSRFTTCTNINLFCNRIYHRHFCPKDTFLYYGVYKGYHPHA